MKIPVKIVGQKEGYGGAVDRRTFKAGELELYTNQHQPVPITQTEYDALFPSVASGSEMLLEDGSTLFLEDGSDLLLEA